MADFSSQRGPEKLTSERKPESRESKEAETRISERADVQKGAREVVSTVETKEGKEGAVEFAEGKVSEQVSEAKKKAPASGSAAMTDDEIEAIRAKLLQNLPPLKEMKRQITSTLRREEGHLKSQFRKAKRAGPKAAFQLNNIVAKLRKIREYFALLANATFEVVKQLWLKIVHGV